MIGVRQAITILLRPHIIPTGIATVAAIRKPTKTVARDRMVWKPRVLFLANF